MIVRLFALTPSRSCWFALANRPRGGASSLRQDDVLVTRTYGGDLCEPDAVDLFDSLAHFQRGFVSLGPFVPYSKPAR